MKNIIYMTFSSSFSFLALGNESLFTDSLAGISDNEKNLVSDTILWFIQTSITALCIILIIITAVKLKNQDYEKGLLSFIAAIIVGIAPLLAKIFTLN